MADTAESVADLIRFIADDQEGVWLDFAVQLSSINAGWREFQRRMLLRGVSLLRKTATIDLPAFTILIDSTQTILSVQTVFGGAVFPPNSPLPLILIPDDFVLPYKLEEKVTGSADDWADMEEKDWPPGVTPGSYLSRWAWQNGALNFLGANRALTIRLLYGKQFPSFEAETDTIPIPFAIDGIAWSTLFQVALARGASDAYRDRCSQMADQQIEQLTAIHVQRDQRVRRHRPAHNAHRF